MVEAIRTHLQKTSVSFSCLALALISSPSLAGELSLDEIVARALQHSPTLQKARAEKRSAEVEAKLAFGVFAPSTLLSGTYRRLSEEEFPELAPGVTFPQFLDSYSLQMTIELPVTEYLFRKPSLFAIARLGLDLQEAKLIEMQESVAEHAAVQALKLHASRNSCEAIRGSITALQSQTDNIKRLVEIGATTKSALLAVQAQAAALETQLIRTEGAVRLMELELALLLGYRANERLPDFKLDAVSKKESARPAYEEALSVAIATRPELVFLKIATKVKENEVGLYSSGRFPNLSVAGSLESANPNNRIFPPSGELETTWSIQAQLSWSPNVFLAQTVQHGRALEALEGLKADLAGLVNLVTLQIAAAYSESENAERLKRATNKRVAAAGAALSEQEVLARIGEVTAQSLLDSVQAHREAVISQIDADVQIRIADIKIRRALGQLTRSVATPREIK